MIPGMMVRPWTSTTRAPWGFFTLAAGPTATILSSFTAMTLFATAGRPVPSMSRAPSNTVVWESAARAADDVTQASASSRTFFMMVSVAGTASSLPLFLSALPAGAIGDLVDKRKYLLFTQTWMTVVAGVLGVVTLFGWMTPWLLLSLISALGIGVAMNQPVWQAIVPEIVPREELAKAITLSGVSLNLARAIGPAVAGLILAATSPGVGFLLNAASFVAVVFVLYRWERIP